MSLPSIQGIHHLKFPVRDLDRSLGFYERALGARRVAAWDHVHKDGTRYAVILEVPGLGTHLELRLDPGAAERQRGFDPVTIAVEDRNALRAWADHLDAAGIPHSPALTAIQGLAAGVRRPGWAATAALHARDPRSGPAAGRRLPLAH
jgi:catechol 2,3-dioxygenase-like lactoylglutathione lyase family enzyme